MRRALVGAIAALLLLAAVALGGMYALLAASLPELDGRIEVPGLAGEVTIERDAAGVPTITGRTRADVAYGLGYAHGQDRYFQMDLSRRFAAGELAELFGPRALDHDRDARRFRFRRAAREVLLAASREQLEVVTAYARGVNDGLGGLASRPWDYWLLRTPPEPWRDEDTVLAVHSMWWQLQYSGFARERRRLALREALEARLDPVRAALVLHFLVPAGTSWDVLNDAPDAVSATAASTLVPAPDIWSPRESGGQVATTAEPDRASREPPPPRAAAGSNNWAVAGTLTASGAALVANDMHLPLGVPAIWYRARLRVSGEGLELNGVTLPGAPLLVAGSNGHIAWGYTNSYGDWLDLRWADCDPDAGTYVALDGSMAALETDTARIRLRDGTRERIDIRSGAEGIVLATRPSGEARQCELATWLATLPAATNFGILGLERATDVGDALALAPGIGIPHQNVVFAGRDGRIAWTILGRVPRATGPLRSAPDAAFLDAQAQPHLVDPPRGLLWTANARVVGPERGYAIGDDEDMYGADYELGARASQIHARLVAAGTDLSPADMLDVQLDDEARFLARWRELLLELLDATALAGEPDRTIARALVADGATHAATDDAGYRIVHAFRVAVLCSTWDFVLGALALPRGPCDAPGQFEQPLWSLVTQRPAHWLDPAYEDWDALLLARLDETLATLRTECGTLERCTWGARLPVQPRHPLSGAVPFASRLIDFPARELPGDHDMPRVQAGAFGASERFAVSPGHERDGYLQVPGGPSGHPLSPYYASGYDDWARGVATPFLPGPARHKLTLAP